jgi:hypothetical protein
MSTNATKEQLDYISKLITEAKQKLAEAACYAAENNVRMDLRIFGEEMHLANLDEFMSDYDLNSKDGQRWYNQQKKEFEQMFGVSEGYVWATSSSFC